MIARTPRVAAMAIGLFLTATSAIAQGTSSAKPMWLTPMDYIEIRQLVSRYAFAVDTGNNNGYDYADLFSADGELPRDAASRAETAALLRDLTARRGLAVK
jgi:hypothetical protein